MLTAHPLARKLLSRALERSRLSHAYLLSGPPGAGKRTLAREFAASLFCETGNFPPCNQCDSCRRVTAGVHPDLSLIEADGKNIKIEAIRELSSRLHLHSYEGGMKAAIIPEAERMTESAQNAFLKTLEEPPPDTVLIMTSTNLSRLLTTISSRCQIIRLGKLPERIIARLVTEQRDLDQEKAKLIASLSQGDARRALDMDLEFVVGFRKEMIEGLLALESEDVIAILDYAEDMARSGQPAEAMLDLFSGFYRDVMHIKLGMEDIWNSDLETQAKAEARSSSLSMIIEKMAMVHTARTRGQGNANPRLNWEILTMALKGVQGAEIHPT